MKKILIALAIAAISGYSAEAQTTEKIACGAPKDKVCRKTNGKVSCYKTKYAEDYKVCKGDYGYFICCEEPGMNNSTHPRLNTASAEPQYPNPMATRDNEDASLVQQAKQQAMIAKAPESQSYPNYEMNSVTAYEGYYTNKHYIKVCYAGDNVAELNNAPYHSCATPAYDGPEANKARNINSNNTIDNIAPITGQSK